MRKAELMSISRNALRYVVIVAGEASADLHGSNLVKAIKKLNPSVNFIGIGGRKMEDAGVKILVPSSDMAVVGLTEVFPRLVMIFKAYLKLRSMLKKVRPHLLILIDYPDFNISLARSAKRLNIPVLYYISPQLWAWRKGRIKKLVKRVDKMAVILPFEEQFYQQKGMDVEYVGHPLLDALPQDLAKGTPGKEKGGSSGFPILGIVPGSRVEEVTNLLPPMMGAAQILSTHYPDLRCVLPIAPTISPSLIESFIRKSQVNVTTFEGNIYEALSKCDLALVASGTATLETAMMEVPMIIVYRVSLMSYLMGRLLVRVPHIGLVNLVAGEEIVPELIQNDVTPRKIAREAFSILEDGQKKQNMVKKLHKLKEHLGQRPPSERTAHIALEMMGEHPPQG
ncbi:MAG: lipid-A-disaccharide synthase [Deltaproteobacteria bacterium]|nr:lipid-A-disaccharide synthase [Deltaproteobacteria bacterium]MBW2044377.1 lipid-A-disaccharide synthase [Deltaproteobacteria bacterium]RLB31690.1 MAG: lipid-A-disaccharide synthase [Deltaproteobacteria bacterium]